MRDIDRVPRLRALWLQRPTTHRKETDMLNFYRYLEHISPELLNRNSGDPYRRLKADLRDLIER